MSQQSNATGRAAHAEVSPAWRHPDPAAKGLKDGDRVAFQVLDEVSPRRYRILVRQEEVLVHSRIPLEKGARYLAEVSLRQGVIHFLSRPIPLNAIESLMAQRQILQTPLSSLLRVLFANTTLPDAFLKECPGAEALRGALANCGLFYEARVREALRRGEGFPFAEDLKGFLLAQGSKQTTASLREAVATALKQLEVHQLLSFQAGPEGPFSFWLPFGGRTIVEGFVKRLRRPRGTELFLALRFPFLPEEELLVTVRWKPARGEVHFAAGPLAYPLLRKTVSRLGDRLSEIGFGRTRVRLSRGLPKGLRAQLGGIRFVESYA